MLFVGVASKPSALCLKGWAAVHVGDAGVSKLWGENLGRMYADEHGLSVLCVRMGHCGDAPEDDRDVGARHSHHAVAASGC